VPKICFVLVAGLDRALLDATPGLKTLASFDRTLALRPVIPAVTCTMQATLTTGVLPEQHGIIANGLYTCNRSALHPHLDLSNFAEFRRQTSFWEQSNALLERPRFWQGTGQRVALLFWQNSMDGAADVVLTPKPQHTPDGKTLTACWSNPANLYAELTAALGPFPLHQYWGPMAGLPSSVWILKAAEEVWRRNLADIQLVYVPHLDYNLQRRGPGDPAVIKDLQDVDAALTDLAAQVRASGGHLIIAGDYSMTAVRQTVFPNVAFRQAGLLRTQADAAGKLLVDYGQSLAFAMADHQIAHVYCALAAREKAADILRSLPGVARVLAGAERATVGLANARSGDLVALAQPDAWFAHDWWLADAEKPAWQLGVDIHRKPGYDPRELFFDPQRKCIAQDAGLVKGSHGLVGPEPKDWPVLLCDKVSRPPNGEIMDATAVACWLRTA